MEIKQEFLSKKQELILNLKKKTNYKENIALLRWSSVLKIGIAGFVLLLISRAFKGIVPFIQDNLQIITILTFVFLGIVIISFGEILLNANKEDNKEYDKLRDRIAEIEQNINDDKEIDDLNIYNEYKDYFEIYKKYIQAIRS